MLKLMVMFCDELIGNFFLLDAPTFGAKLIDVVIDTLQHFSVGTERSFAENCNQSPPRWFDMGGCESIQPGWWWRSKWTTFSSLSTLLPIFSSIPSRLLVKCHFISKIWFDERLTQCNVRICYKKAGRLCFAWYAHLPQPSINLKCP